MIVFLLSLTLSWIILFHLHSRIENSQILFLFVAMSVKLLKINQRSVVLLCTCSILVIISRIHSFKIAILSCLRTLRVMLTANLSGRRIASFLANYLNYLHNKIYIPINRGWWCVIFLKLRLIIMCSLNWRQRDIRYTSIIDPVSKQRFHWLIMKLLFVK